MVSGDTELNLGRIRRYQHELPEWEHISKAWNLLENYSGIPPDEIEPHLRKVRDQAFAVFNYPCLGRWRFLDLYITTHPAYPELLARTKAGAVLLDAACCVGQALRQLAFDGAPQENLRGFDLRRDFIELGYDLFRDRDTFRVPFATGDALDPADKGLSGLDGTVDIIHAAAFFHLFGWDEQVRLGERLVRFFKEGIENAVVLGRQVGTPEPGGERGRYLHNEGSMQRLWDEIGERTGTRWKVRAELSEEKDTLEGGGEVVRSLIRYEVRKA
ncbi:hypothetical protein B0T16DRAFT_492134 [Cercophora newfieldiana]|uniref:Methyltransferase domain-containing protein n=1 Tax=Cercophora newfieldiana TaxID=92897 RepID=A0AA39YBD6_9PEZI|nr:hypothetical protein B0T16DRAFT_492134 [Cercophora newfieldiana]